MFHEGVGDTYSVGSVRKSQPQSLDKYYIVPAEYFCLPLEPHPTIFISVLHIQSIQNVVKAVTLKRSLLGCNILQSGRDFTDVSEECTTSIFISKNKPNKQKASSKQNVAACSAYLPTLKMEAVRSLERSVNSCQTTRTHIADNSTLHLNSASKSSVSSSNHTSK
jgi:hypothetical protein